DHLHLHSLPTRRSSDLTSISSCSSLKSLINSFIFSSASLPKPYQNSISTFPSPLAFDSESSTEHAARTKPITSKKLKCFKYFFILIFPLYFLIYNYPLIPVSPIPLMIHLCKMTNRINKGITDNTLALIISGHLSANDPCEVKILFNLTVIR